MKKNISKGEEESKRGGRNDLKIRRSGSIGGSERVEKGLSVLRGRPRHCSSSEDLLTLILPIGTRASVIEKSE